MASKKADPRVDKRRVTMTTYTFGAVDDKGEPKVLTTQVIDYVRVPRVRLTDTPEAVVRDSTAAIEVT